MINKYGIEEEYIDTPVTFNGFEDKKFNIKLLRLSPEENEYVLRDSDSFLAHAIITLNEIVEKQNKRIENLEEKIKDNNDK